jgi:hypothetical protein
MTTPEPQNWQERLQDLKIDLDATKQKIFDGSNVEAENLNEVEVDYSNFLGLDALKQGYQQFVTWFNEIPSSGKLLAIAGGGLLSLTLIKTVFQLISSLITLSVFAAIVYLVYRFWIAPKSTEQE